MFFGLEMWGPGPTRAFCREALDRGLILNWTLHRDCVVRLAPPRVSSEKESDRALQAIGESLRAVSP